MKISFFILRILSLFPVQFLHFLAKILTIPAYFLAKKRRKIGAINLQKCFPDKTQKERDILLKKNIYHMLAMGFEYPLCWWNNGKKLYQLTTYTHKHYLDDALNAGKKVILFYPHFSALEICLHKLNQDVPLVSVYSHQKNPIIDEQFLKGRYRYNNVFLVGRNDGLLSIIRTLKKQSAPFLYLPDQDFGRENSVFVPFFNISTATTDGLSRIARLTGSVVIPLIATRLKNGKFNLTFYPEWDNFPTNDSIADTVRMNQFLEDRILENPEQYFWLHKRFKTRPEGEQSFYS